MEKRFFGVPGIFPAGMVLCRNVSVLADYRILKKSAYINRSANLKHSKKINQFNCRRKLRKSQMAKYKFNDDIPAEEAVATIRVVERYANAVEFVEGNIVLAMLGIEKVEEKQ